ncbi:endonuclease/exonuclease/phosphatase family protein [Bacteroides helcogenes]|uniref:Endonuclease/exonuclease/phosphatase n=1 Tax=Bacteroides helcogenes (strain ATCC 35417 / DSM 20613 / JCM 6297 / CCUG 15421 / P 36-108) TaxID=693979 RepID=E6SWD1_BACT6|nr:endonuclease/exonuclease/phosphatase family protein [Bacteroides helcogenes]ADV44592.1 Endonuclease/exonuclease/phosphatase [Bacteroides helcogenes P 36-108]MDY5238881.1 endonuclease/exonuclease/phosphatase family protein [Bacteroides helcogenes]
MGKSAVKGLFYICLTAATFVLASVTIVAGFSGNVDPANSVVMPLLGLAVPVLLIVNLIVALCWALARKCWAVVPLVAICCNWTYLSSVIQLNGSKEKIPGGKYLKIATYNVQDFGYEVTGYSCKEIARFMEREGVDVLCFQEFDDNEDFPMDSIRRALSHWPYALIPNDDSIRGVLPMAVFSRYPLSGHRFITYQGSANCSMMCDIALGTDTIRLLNNHLQTTSVSQKRRKWEREMKADDTRREVHAAKDAAYTLHENFVKRTEQTYIISYYAKHSPYPVLVCGDFNSLPSSHTYYHLREFLKDGFRTAGHGYMHTYRYGKGLLRIDYIFHSPTLEGIDYYSPDLDLCSDHNPVIMEVGY